MNFDAVWAWALPNLALAGVVGWVGKTLYSNFRTARAKKRGATSLAILLAVSHETYALECASTIFQNVTHQSTEGQDGKLMLEFPKPAEFWASTNWENLDRDLEERVLTFPNVVREAEMSFSFGMQMENDDESDAIDRFVEKAGHTAIKAWELACALRTKYGVVPFRMDEIGWNFVAYLRETHGAAVKARSPSARSSIDLAEIEDAEKGL